MSEPARPKDAPLTHATGAVSSKEAEAPDTARRPPQSTSLPSRSSLPLSREQRRSMINAGRPKETEVDVSTAVSQQERGIPLPTRKSLQHSRDSRQRMLWSRSSSGIVSASGRPPSPHRTEAHTTGAVPTEISTTSNWTPTEKARTDNARVNMVEASIGGASGTVASITRHSKTRNTINQRDDVVYGGSRHRDNHPMIHHDHESLVENTTPDYPTTAAQAMGIPPRKTPARRLPMKIIGVGLLLGAGGGAATGVILSGPEKNAKAPAMFNMTRAPTTMTLITDSPVTKAPTPFVPILTSTNAPSTQSPSTIAPTTNIPTTLSPSTMAPSTDIPTTMTPTTDMPTTMAPSTADPTTALPTSEVPTTAAEALAMNDSTFELLMKAFDVEDPNILAEALKSVDDPLALIETLLLVPPTTFSPSENPTASPSVYPTDTPSAGPSVFPTTTVPTDFPSASSSSYPSASPTESPTSNPSDAPTKDDSDDINDDGVDSGNDDKGNYVSNFNNEEENDGKGDEADNEILSGDTPSAAPGDKLSPSDHPSTIQSDDKNDKEDIENEEGDDDKEEGGNEEDDDEEEKNEGNENTSIAKDRRTNTPTLFSTSKPSTTKNSSMPSSSKPISLVTSKPSSQKPSTSKPSSAKPSTSKTTSSTKPTVAPSMRPTATAPNPTMSDTIPTDVLIKETLNSPVFKNLVDVTSNPLTAITTSSKMATMSTAPKNNDTHIHHNIFLGNEKISLSGV